jgi:dienelactone hydrolase
MSSATGRPSAPPDDGHVAACHDTLRSVHWPGTTVVDKGVRERRFDVERAGRTIPGLLWTPADGESPRPLVLVGHGGSGSKREDYVVALARRLVRRRQLAVAAIDGPVHGDRRKNRASAPDVPLLDFAQAWSGDDGLTDAMVADWRTTLDELQKLPDVGDGRTAWWGLSMGTILGLPFVAAEPRINAAVLGLMGLTGPTRTRIASDAPKVKCPVLFLMQWHDELFGRDTALALFDALGSLDKRLHANVGLHGEVPPEEFEQTEQFLSRHLLGD